MLAGIDRCGRTSLSFRLAGGVGSPAGLRASRPAAGRFGGRIRMVIRMIGIDRDFVADQLFNRDSKFMFLRTP